MKFLSLLALFCLAVGCAESGPGEPPVDTPLMGRVVADMHLAESVLGEVPILIRDSMRDVYYDNTLAEHDLSRAEFDSLMWIVRSEPAWIDSVYTLAGEHLSRDLAETSALSSPRQ